MCEGWKMKLKITALIVVILISGCGIKGPPLPPIEEQTVQQMMNHADVKPASFDDTKPKTKKDK